ncbi:arsenate reductase ArsC [Paludibaculum fermentans]|uniref:arsenate reductase/protein-tyrosine-phosphatase family protein n=1 Tax=Paludibaculum fermentans TaxID=1473598 RepID=UPI003EBCD877
MKVLFVCIGNACRSQMAEGFARAYGADVLEVESAGLSPASMIPEVTRKVMLEKGIKMDDQFPKDVMDLQLHDVDLVVNLSGVALRGLPITRSRDWKVKDPVGQKESFHRQIRDELENLVMSLILEMRNHRQSWPTGAASAPRG